MSAEIALQRAVRNGDFVGAQPALRQERDAARATALRHESWGPNGGYTTIDELADWERTLTEAMRDWPGFFVDGQDIDSQAEIIERLLDSSSEEDEEEWDIVEAPRWNGTLGSTTICSFGDNPSSDDIGPWDYSDSEEIDYP